jgi:hypothetical protein
MRKTTLVIILFLVIFISSIGFAANAACSPTVKWVFVPTKTSLPINWYYAPEFTTINDQKEIETWIKDEYTGENTEIYNTGEYTITHYLINASGDKYLKNEWSIYDKNGNLIKHLDDPNADWKNIRPGSGFEQCVKAILQFAKYQ